MLEIFNIGRMFSNLFKNPQEKPECRKEAVTLKGKEALVMFPPVPATVNYELKSKLDDIEAVNQELLREIVEINNKLLQNPRRKDRSALNTISQFLAEVYSEKLDSYKINKKIEDIKKLVIIAEEVGCLIEDGIALARVKQNIITSLFENSLEMQKEVLNKAPTLSI